MISSTTVHPSQLALVAQDLANREKTMIRKDYVDIEGC